MKILVTGGAGFIGSHIVDQLLQRGDEVVIVDNLSSGFQKNVNKNARFMKMDIGSPELLALFEQERFAYVIHQAAQTKVSASIGQPGYDCQVNIAGTVNVLEACRKTAVKRIVFASTAAVYGDVETVPVVENAPLNPTSFYGLSKLTVERYLELYRQVFGLDYMVLRYANVYGERQNHEGEGGVISIFCHQIATGQPVVIFGDGTQTRDFIYVGDVAAANLQALTAPVCNTICNVSTKTEVNLNELADLIGQSAGVQAVKCYGQPRQGDIYRSSLDNANALNKLAWQACMPLAQGLDRTYQSLKADALQSQLEKGIG